MLEVMNEFDRTFTQNRYTPIVKDLEAERQEQTGSEAA